MAAALLCIAPLCIALLCIALLGVALGSSAAPAPGANPALLDARSDEPRAFGYQVGDRVARSVRIHVPDGLLLDEPSLPRPGARGGALELRSVVRDGGREAGGQRLELTLAYQVFLAPAQVRTLEMPAFTLRFSGTPRAQELRIDAWPVTVAPLVPLDVSPRRGLGELQPDAPPPLIDTAATRRRLLASAVVLALIGGYFVHVYIGLPWWRRTQRPFTQAWRALRAAQAGDAATGDPAAARRAAFQRVHEALNRSAGEVLFASGVAGYVAAQPRFAPLRADLDAFFERSRREFFGAGSGAGAADATDPAWLLAFCRRCRDAERGAP